MGQVVQQLTSQVNGAANQLKEIKDKSFQDKLSKMQQKLIRDVVVDMTTPISRNFNVE